MIGGALWIARRVVYPSFVDVTEYIIEYILCSSGEKCEWCFMYIV